MLRPRRMLLDEPSFGLAPLVVRELFGILGQINRENRVSMLLVEQNASLALELADHAYLLETGRVVMAGPAAEIGRDENRSEEHTSELQSLMRISYAVFCLKKKKTNTHATTNDH